MLAFAVAAVLATEVTRYSAFEELESSGDVVGVVVDSRNAIVGLAGRFPMNCEPRNEKSLTDGVIRFLNDHADQFLLQSEIDADSLLITNISWDNDRAFVTFDQVREKVPIVGGDIVFVLDEDCSLLSFNGAFQIEAPVTSPARRTNAVQNTDYRTKCETGAEFNIWPVPNLQISERSVFIPDHGLG